MSKVEDNKSNFEKCICPECPLYIGRKCSKVELKNDEKLYCARTVSKCKMGEGICYCPGCPVYKESKLAGTGFCVEEIGEI